MLLHVSELESLITKCGISEPHLLHTYTGVNILHNFHPLRLWYIGSCLPRARMRSRDEAMPLCLCVCVCRQKNIEKHFTYMLARVHSQIGDAIARAAAWEVLWVWPTEIGWVLSIAGVVSIQSPLAHSRTELRLHGRAIQELELIWLISSRKLIRN